MRDAGILLARICLVVLFLVSAVGKWGDIPGLVETLTAKGVPGPMFFAYFSASAELLGALAVAFGILTRPAAIGLALYTVATMLVVHSFWAIPDPKVAEAQTTQFLKNLGLVGGFLLLAVTGAGRLSLDALLGARMPAIRRLA